MKVPNRNLELFKCWSWKFFNVDPDFTSGVCFRCTSSFSHPGVATPVFFVVFSKSSLCFLRQVRSVEAKNEPSLLGLRACFPLIAISWMKINEETSRLSASALGIVRKLNYGDSSQARFNNICIMRPVIPLGIVTQLLSHTPKRPSPKRLRPFPRIARPNGVI